MARGPKWGRAEGSAVVDRRVDGDVAVWVLDAAVVIVFGPVPAGFAAVVGCDVAAATVGSGCEVGCL